MTGHWWQRKPKKKPEPKIMPFKEPERAAPREAEPEPIHVEESTADTALLKQLGFPDKKKPPPS